MVKAVRGSALDEFPPPREASRFDWFTIVVSLLVVVAAFLYFVRRDRAFTIGSAETRQWVLVFPADPAHQTAQDAVSQFHDRFTQGRYADICSTVEPPGGLFLDLQLRQPLPCAEYLGRVRAGLGSPEYAKETQFWGRSDGRDIELDLDYLTRYQGGNAVENFSWHIREGRIRLTSYQVQSEDALFPGDISSHSHR